MKTKRTAALVCAALISLSALTSCRAGKTEYSDSDYFVMNANMKLRLASSGASDDVLNSASAAAQKIASDIEKELSVNIAGTPAELFNSSDGGTEDPDGVFSAVLKTALDLAAATDGAYDPTIGALSSLWNINGGGPVPSEESIGDALSHVGYGKVSLENGKVYKDDSALRVDLGGIGKGYAVQKIVEYLPTAGVKYGLCSFGSTVGVFGSKPDGKKFRITVCDPDDTSKNVISLEIESGFVSSSGDYERYFEENGKRYHHIFDPSTGYPADSGVRSVTVCAADGALSDALATALFVMGVERSLEFYKSSGISFEAVFITDEGVYTTDGLKSGDTFSLLSEKYKLLN